METSLEVLKSEISNEIAVADIVIDDKESFEVAGDMVIELKGLKVKVEEYWKPLKEKSYVAWKDIVAREKEMLEPIGEAINGITRKINLYLTEQKRKEEEARARAEEERRQKEEEERAKLNIQLEQAKEAGDKAAVELIQMQKETVYVPAEEVEIMEKTARIEAGSITGKQDINVSIVDQEALIKQLLEDKALDIIEIKESKLKTYLKLRQADKYPGVKIEKVVTASFRGKKGA